MAVLLYHFGVPGLDGGYVGVDVFFVISGFLITRLIADEVAVTGRFDFRNFYARRIRRILPALLVTMAATAAVAIISLAPADLVAFGRSLVASAMSLSNILFWSESGYFDAASETKPLLHTWSLGVEEQFYLVWPALLYLCGRRYGKRGLFWGIVVVGAVSFLANHAAVIAQGVGYQSSLFFLPHFRVFEFAIGALGCLLSSRLIANRWVHEAMMISGLALIGWSIVRLDEGAIFPYVNAIAPCLGALLVIGAEGSRLTGSLLANGVSVWIGRISYSLYLVHWPIVVFLGQSMPTAPWGMKFLLMAALSLVAAIALHYLIEVRFRHPTPGTGKRGRLSGILAGAVALGMAGGALSASNGMPGRYQYFTPGSWGEPAGTGSPPPGGIKDEGPAGQPPAFLPLDAAMVDAGKVRRLEDLAGACRIDALADADRCFMRRPAQVLLFGNSHEPDAFNAFNQIYGQDDRVNLINFGTVNECQIVFDAGGFSSPTQELGCSERFRVLNDPAFLRQVGVIIYNTHQGFDPVARDLWRVLENVKVRNPGIRIVAIGSYLQTTMECAALYNRFRTFDACRRAEFVDYHNPRERVDSAVDQVHSLDYLYISKYRLLCGGDALENCETSAGGEPAFYDKHHLSRGFARHLGDRIAQVHGADLVRLGLPAPAGKGMEGDHAR